MTGRLESGCLKLLFPVVSPLEDHSLDTLYLLCRECCVGRAKILFFRVRLHPSAELFYKRWEVVRKLWNSKPHLLP